ncbi:MAG: hypothetical protein A2Z25_18240 [Planctomycetes bacterium RBG_16_55_9]|nr:MAG: hypothetical protein A2Z25_18240 [Planctomycetes bacterium RBG_16_55_9]
MAIALMTMGILGLIIRFTVKDRWSVVAPVFYGLPPLVVVVAVTLSAGLFALRRNKRLAVAAFAGVILSVVTWIHSDYVHAAARNRTGEEFTIVFWNIGPPAKSKEAFIADLKQANGQIIVLAESGRCDEKARQFWTFHFPGYHISLLGGGLTLLSKYSISNATMHKMGPWTRIGVYDLDTTFGRVSIVVPDIISNPFVSRRPYIDRTYEIAASRPYPTIVLGDFNTPHSSALFADFRRTYHHAFEEAGDGLITTWPALFPLLALDHIWLSGHFVPLRTQLRRTFRSDHALVISDVQMGRARE